MRRLKMGLVYLFPNCQVHVFSFNFLGKNCSCLTYSFSYINLFYYSYIYSVLERDLATRLSYRRQHGRCGACRTLQMWRHHVAGRGASFQLTPRARKTCTPFCAAHLSQAPSSPPPRPQRSAAPTLTRAIAEVE